MQARALAQGRVIRALDGSVPHLVADTLCLHSNTPGAIQIARTDFMAVNGG